MTLSAEKAKMDLVCDYHSCFGCGACLGACPRGAISFIDDPRGNRVPHIEKDKCVDCGLCQAACPAINPSDFHKPQEVYAAISKDENDYRSCTSGGIATAFSKAVLEEGGTVYGAAFEDNFALRHIRVSSLEEIDRLKGSKYTQSFSGDCFHDVKADLADGRRVLFVGTPCQVDGLLHYLKKPYQNLLTVNLICHGVPSNKLLTEHLKTVAPDASHGARVSFRDGEKANYVIKVSQGDTVLYSRPFHKDYYYLGFMRKLFYKPGCYSCKYAKQERIGDITIGDFWGFDASSQAFPVKTPHGLSAVLINTDKGKAFWSGCSQTMITQKRTLPEVTAGNPQLRHPPEKHKHFDRFYALYTRHGFEKAAKRILWPYSMAYSGIFFLQKIRGGLKK